MFKIQDGRKSFTQWDLNRKIIIEDDSNMYVMKRTAANIVRVLFK